MVMSSSEEKLLEALNGERFVHFQMEKMNKELYNADINYLEDLLEKAEEDKIKLAEWLVDTLGYPIDMTTDPPVPEFLRKLIEIRWWERERHVDSLEDISMTVAQEGGWYE